jgi:hypothetical protein
MREVWFQILVDQGLWTDNIIAVRLLQYVRQYQVLSKSAEGFRKLELSDLTRSVTDQAPILRTQERTPFLISFFPVHGVLFPWPATAPTRMILVGGSLRQVEQ